MTRASRFIAAIAAAGLAATAGSLLPVAPAMAAPRLVQINGAGSSWSANAIDNWRRNVLQRGIYVNYASTGSTDGRNQFRNGTVDFGVSEIPYGLRDVFAGSDTRPPRDYAYMPIVAGGTAFMYNLRIGGRQVTNLRLSGDVLSKIFTGVIRRWDDRAIKADNPGLSLPDRAIVPVVRSDGSGTTAQFTLWMGRQYPSIWNAYCGKHGKPAPCGLTSVYPEDSFSVRQNGSTGVAGYVAQRNAEGAITYVEYSYAKNAGFPVVKVRNAANYYVEPTAQNVAVALTKARINNSKGSNDYLTQILDDVYRSNDPRAYPLSSYSYMLIPTKNELGVNDDKGYTLSSFAYYFLCEGQQQADVLGYSPLPINLVTAGLEQVARIPGVQKQNIKIQSCHNPTFSADGTNTLAKTAPQPSRCDKAGSEQNPKGTGGALAETPVLPAARCTGSGGGADGGGANSGNKVGPSGGAVPNGGVNPSANADAGVAGDGTGDAGLGVDDVSAVRVNLDSGSGWTVRQTMMLLAALCVAGLILAPPLLARRFGPPGDRGDR